MEQLKTKSVSAALLWLLVIPGKIILDAAVSGLVLPYLGSTGETIGLLAMVLLTVVAIIFAIVMTIVSAIKINKQNKTIQQKINKNEHQKHTSQYTGLDYTDCIDKFINAKPSKFYTLNINFKLGSNYDLNDDFISPLISICAKHGFVSYRTNHTSNNETQTHELIYREGLSVWITARKGYGARYDVKAQAFWPFYDTPDEDLYGILVDLIYELYEVKNKRFEVCDYEYDSLYYALNKKYETEVLAGVEKDVLLFDKNDTFILSIRKTQED